MKLIIFLIIALQFNFVSAQENNIAACEIVQPMAILVKNNIPYWSQAVDQQQKNNCYEALKAFVDESSPGDVAQLENEFEGQIRIFSKDADFAHFIEEHSDQEAFVVETSNHSLTPVFRPKKTIFFQN